MKKLNQHLLLAAAMMLAASAAHAQSNVNPTNQFSRKTSDAREVVDPYSKLPTVNGASAGTPAGNYGAYSQDSYIQQTSTSQTNDAYVDQKDTRMGSLATNSGSTATISQSGAGNKANQNQTLNASSNVAGGRNFVSSTQAGDASQTDQTQVGGYNNAAMVTQGAGTSGNRAIQSQTGNGHDNSARITQSNASGFAATTGNRAEQSQTGNNQIAVTEQQGSNSYASQTQSGASNSAYIGQGAPGTGNTAWQTQSGTMNNASIRQSVGTTANNNYADQRQTGYGDQAAIEQHSSSNFARQDQSGAGTYYQNNNSLITQSTVSSAAYTVQGGSGNQAVVTQH